MEYKYPIYQPLLNGNEKKYVMDCLESTWISSKGKYISLFEGKFADFLGIKNAASVSNGTVALHLALIALGIGEGDEVIVPTLTYIASVNAIAYTGATPVFSDSLLSTWQIDPADIKKKITAKTKAVLVVHLYGQPCNLDEIIALCKENNIYLIEDCAEAIGSKYKGKYVGTFGDIATFSFFGNKTITTGEGGMVVTNDETLFDRVVHFKGQGLAKHREYWHDVIGYNYRMTNICAAIGYAQMENIDGVIQKKREIANAYISLLDDLPLTVLGEYGDVENTFWMNCILVQSQFIRDELREFLKENRIETRPVFYPVHTMPMYASHYQKYPNAEFIGWRGINLPSYPELEFDDVSNICGVIKQYYEK